jgi:hypothetical protein
MFRKEINELAKTKGSGWVDYIYLNPTTKMQEPYHPCRYGSGLRS